MFEALAVAVLLLVATLALILLQRLLARRAGEAGPVPGSPGSPPYAPRPHLLTEGERLFLRSLREAVGDRYEVVPRVRLADLLEVPHSHARGRQVGGGDLFAGERLHFVLATPEDFRPLAAILLDSSSAAGHGGGRRPNGTTAEDALRAAGIPLLRFAARSEWRAEDIRTAVDAIVARDRH